MSLKFALAGLVGLHLFVDYFKELNHVSIFFIFYNFVILYIHNTLCLCSCLIDLTL